MPDLLTRSKSKAINTLPAARAAETPRTPISCLMVSPFPSDHRLVHEVFEHWSWDLVCTTTCGEAAAVLSCIRIPVILSERTLRDGDWRTFLNWELDVPPRVVVISRMPDAGLHDEVSALGGFSVLESPLDSREVAAAVSMAWHSVQRQRRATKI